MSILLLVLYFHYEYKHHLNPGDIYWIDATLQGPCLAIQLAADEFLSCYKNNKEINPSSPDYKYQPG